LDKTARNPITQNKNAARYTSTAVLGIASLPARNGNFGAQPLPKQSITFLDIQKYRDAKYILYHIICAWAL
jgi:hypothetical protein